MPGDDRLHALADAKVLLWSKRAQVAARDRRLLGRLNEVNRLLGYPEMPEYDPARRGAADSAFVAADVDTLAGLGMAGGGAHAEGEWVDLTSLPRQAIRTALLMMRLSRN